MRWIVDTFGGATEAFKDFISTVFLNPLQSLLAESPWWLTALAILALAVVFGGVRAVIITACLPGRHLLPRPVARRDGHPQHDAGRHRPW